MGSDIIIFDTGNQPFLNNQIFTEEVARKYPGAMSILIFHELATKQGYRLMTADFALTNNVDVSDALVITEIISPWTRDLEKKGAKLAILICLETPSFAWKFYSNLTNISKSYAYCFLFPGAIDKVSKNSKAYPCMFPQPDIGSIKQYDAPWSERKFMTNINSNQIRRVFKPGHIIAAWKDKSLKEEQYSLRLAAIEYFHKDEDFHLYGRNWDKRIWGIPKRQYLAALSCYKGAVKDKIETLSHYRFSICFENAVYKGYITEKIFDCFYAGCVPIYYGAPDIEKYIPEECYIDFRNFKSFDELRAFLNAVTEERFTQYQNSIKSFLRSEAFKKFSEERYAADLLNVIQKASTD
jgi:hypothetical protein